jgi:hypothetical protein
LKSVQKKNRRRKKHDEKNRLPRRPHFSHSITS